MLADQDERAAQEAAKKAEAAGSHPGFKAFVLKMDITDEMSVRAMVSRTIQELGRIDYAVNAAGVCRVLARTFTSALTLYRLDRILVTPYSKPLLKNSTRLLPSMGEVQCFSFEKSPKQ